MTRRLRSLPLTFWIFMGMAAGILIGVLWPGVAVKLAPISSVFLRLIKSILAPLIFGTLVAGIAGAGGLGAVNLLQPGAGLHLTRSGSEIAQTFPKQTLDTVLEHIFPSSIADAMARGDVLQIVVFSFLFGAACLAIGTKSEPVVRFCESLSEVMFRYTNYVMYLAPLGVAAAMAVTVGSKGIHVLFGLGKLLGTLYFTLAVFVVCVLGAVMLITRVPLKAFFAAVRGPGLIAFSTASSEAALPLALENMERFGVPKHIVGFVLPTGYSFNLDGTTLYLSIASIFVAQAAGIQLTLGQQLLMMLTLMLSSKGVAGIPRSSIVVLSATLATFNLPMEGVAVILGVDALMDMGRTLVNVLGNCLASAVVARWEGVQFQNVAVRVENGIDLR
jgi:proton glutamate symport protein